MIKFNKFNVRNTVTKQTARVHYSLDNRIDGRKCVTIYGRDYGHTLGQIFDSVSGEYKNDTDMQTDYFDKGRVVIFEGDTLYTEARNLVEAFEAEREEKYAAKRAA